MTFFSYYKKDYETIAMLEHGICGNFNSGFQVMVTHFWLQNKLSFFFEVSTMVLFCFVFMNTFKTFKYTGWNA